MARFVSLRALARDLGVTLKTVQKARDSGRITLREDGKVDLAQARKDWVENTLHTKRHRGGKKADGTPDTGEDQGEEAGSLGNMGAEFRKAQAVRATVQARMAQLDYEERRGKLLDAEGVERAAFNAARRLRDKLLTIPGKFGPVLAGEASPAKCTRILDKAIGDVLDGLAGVPSQNGKPKPKPKPKPKRKKP